ncbi:DUF4352 domain-containing protein [Streptomyces sp. SID3343]|uniref:DUF4352 domain-containing protein n=1 Tax=Streptomyces sp. SID3343 TaxID=2690260 RepID=UPI00136B205C|nr:DUF4352 domain-containing protein [Streptomyces sp. SID3343]MYW06134.1 DUF4352 domain-containing protein [Streptomyces sp. SID3343]
MHHRIAVVGAALSAVVALAGCSGDRDGGVKTQPKAQVVTTTPLAEDKSTPAPTGNEQASHPASTKPAPTKPAPPAPAKVGDTIALQDRDGSAVEVTVVQVVDPATSANQFGKPKEGNRWIAIQWRVTNKGSKVVDRTPNFGSNVIDEQGQQFGTTYGETTAGPAFASSVQIPAGSSRLGFVTYEVPEASKIVDIQFGFSGADSDQVGQWRA